MGSGKLISFYFILFVSFRLERWDGTERNWDNSKNGLFKIPIAFIISRDAFFFKFQLEKYGDGIKSNQNKSILICFQRFDSIYFVRKLYFVTYENHFVDVFNHKFSY